MSSQTQATIPGGMHRCLRIAEIQMEIFRTLSPADAATLARTCTAFYDQAMNVVWARVESFIPFVMCIPSEALEKTKEKADAPRKSLITVEFNRELQSADWQLFCKHARRVKVFSDIIGLDVIVGPYRRYDTYRLAPSALDLVGRFICQHGADGGSLFSRLNRLLLCDLSIESSLLPKYLPYLCRHTGTFEINACNSESTADIMSDDMRMDWPTIMPLLSSAWPGLRLIKFLWSFKPPKHQIEQYIQAMSLWLRSLSQLKKFKTYLGLEPSMLTALSTLPLLHTLDLNESEYSLDGRHRTEFDSESLQLSSACFPSLKVLCIHANSDTPALVLSIPLLQGLGGSNTLTRVDITFPNIPSTLQSAARILTLFEAISRISPLETLQINLSTSEESPDESEYKELVLSGQLLSTLFPLRHMRDLTLGRDFRITIEDQDLFGAAAAWPNLEKLTFSFDSWKFRYHVLVPEVTLVGVQALYIGCPNLKQVNMSIDARLPTSEYAEHPGEIFLDIRAPAEDSRNCSMELLNLVFVLSGGDRTYEDVHMTSFLGTAICFMFPRLDSLYAGLYYKGRWEKWERAVERYWRECLGMKSEARVRALLYRRWSGEDNEGYDSE
ncbi:hypothetical protein BDY19DRAFT_967713 [Irpex rosettiformis]|uniref:Uncharacterized protein n=1 Tax=Irpex rosettiformis TaxID=378272 RepID=A0ACB8TSS6_9APHY|nr:hypothetical protein BDY19DRAFT_967713 [Irpex rosettiformis]